MKQTWLFSENLLFLLTNPKKYKLCFVIQPRSQAQNFKTSYIVQFNTFQESVVIFCVTVAETAVAKMFTCFSFRLGKGLCA